MIDHITLGVSDFSRSTAFYDQALAPLGISRLVDISKDHADGVNLAGYGDKRPFFWLAEENATRGFLHVAFAADNRAQVNAYHAAALRAGGADNGGPGLRTHYHPDYFAAFVRDPDGHNIEAVCHTPPP